MSDPQRPPVSGAIDPAAMSSARAAIERLSANFKVWLDAEVVKLVQARADVPLARVGPDRAGRLYMHAHDLKGLAATFGYPLITSLAASLCDLMDDEDRTVEEQIGLIDDHIDAIVRCAREEIRTEDDPAAQRMLQDLARDIAYRD